MIDPPIPEPPPVIKTERPLRSGNISVRGVEDGIEGFFITPSGKKYETLEPKDIVFLSLTEEKDFSLFVYEKGSIANLPINTQLLYARIGESLKLAWRTQIYGSKSVAVYIDANTGELLKEASLDVTCAFHKDMYHNHSSSCVNHALETVAEEVNESIDVDNSVYHVFPLPLESPNHGSRSILTNPADPIASPLGWHDTNGQEGPEFTITRGNNVHAFYDPEADEVPPTNEVDGGADLVFDFDYFSFYMDMPWSV